MGKKKTLKAIDEALLFAYTEGRKESYRLIKTWMQQQAGIADQLTTVSPSVAVKRFIVAASVMCDAAIAETGNEGAGYQLVEAVNQGLETSMFDYRQAA